MAMFFRGHTQKFSPVRGKENQPKKSLGLLMRVPLQLIVHCHYHTVICINNQTVAKRYTWKVKYDTVRKNSLDGQLGYQTESLDWQLKMQTESLVSEEIK